MHHPRHQQQHACKHKQNQQHQQNQQHHQHIKDNPGLEWRFKHLTHSYMLARNATFQRFEISEYGQPLILFILKDSAKDKVTFTQKELSQCMGISQTTTAVSLKSLERLGCVRRKSDLRDLRRNHVEITAKGLKVADLFRQAFDYIDSAMYKDFSPEEKELIGSFFVRMSENLTEIIQPDLQADPLPDPQADLQCKCGDFENLEGSKS